MLITRNEVFFSKPPPLSEYCTNATLTFTVKIRFLYYSRNIYIGAVDNSGDPRVDWGSGMELYANVPLECTALHVEITWKCLRWTHMH